MDLVGGSGGDEVVEEQRVVVGAFLQGYDVSEGWGVANGGLYEVLVSTAHDEESGVAELEHVGDFLGAGAVVEGDENGVELGAGEVGLDEFRGVDVHEGDTAAGLEAKFREGVG